MLDAANTTGVTNSPEPASKQFPQAATAKNFMLNSSTASITQVGMPTPSAANSNFSIPLHRIKPKAKNANIAQSSSKKQLPSVSHN